MDARSVIVRNDGSFPSFSFSLSLFEWGKIQTGLPPFYDENVNMMYQRILTDPLNFPLDMPSEAWGVMTGLLQRDPTRRLGANGGEEIKRHPFFAKYIDWNRYVPVGRCYARTSVIDLYRLLAKKIQPPFKPSVVRLYLFVFAER